MKVETEVSIDSNPEVVVHDEDRSRVFVQLGCVRVVCDRHLRLISLLLVRVENHGPAVSKAKLTAGENEVEAEAFKAEANRKQS